MDITDLSRVLHLTQSQNMQKSAQAFSLTVGAMSKSLKRIEEQLRTPLFDRVGRNLVINHQGKKFAAHARLLVHEAQQLQNEFAGSSQRQTVRIAGPAMIVNYWLPQVGQWLPAEQFVLNLQSWWEGDAVAKVVSGQVDFAIVTEEALVDVKGSDCQSVPLRTTQFSLAHSALHPLEQRLCGKTPRQISPETLREQMFACPTRSPLCGKERGIGSDGWCDNDFPRHIGYRTDELSTLLRLVEQGAAIAYLPDYVIDAHQFERLAVRGCAYRNEENIVFVYRPSRAHGWLNQLAEKVAQTAVLTA